MKIEYFDLKSETRLEAYADTIVLEKEGNINYIAAIRFGGYPESVKGMSEAIYGGGTITVEENGNFLTAYSRVKQYRKEFSHDGIYAEATLLIRDEEETAESEEKSNQNGKPRKCYLFCEHNNPDRLFEELDKKTGVPLIPEFKEYVLSELQKRGILKPLQVISNRENFDMWLLTLTENEKNIIKVVNEGLRSGAISIPNSKGKEFPEVRSVTQYLNTFGVLIAERIKNQFQPLFDPATVPLRKC